MEGDDEPDLIVVSVKKASRRTTNPSKRVFVIDSDTEEEPPKKTTSTLVSRQSTRPVVNQGGDDNKQTIQTHKEFKVTCPICLETPKDPASTTCGHVFCWRCIHLSLQELGRCPTCRKKLSKKSIHRLFLG